MLKRHPAPLSQILTLLVLGAVVLVSCDGDSPNGPDVGNRAPILAPIGDRSTLEGINLSFVVTATDPDGTVPTLSTGLLPSGATFVDSGNGNGLFDWTPGSAQLGTHSLTFHAVDDSLAADSEAISITVGRAGTRVVAVNGAYYRQDVGETVVTPELQFAVTDDGGSYFPNQWIYFTVIAGDDTVSDDSLQSDGSGIATIGYTFSDSVGHAVIRASAPGRDSVEVILRRSCLIPGAGGQGQYLLLNENYGMIKTFNGPPDALVVHPDEWWFVAVYEASLGVVFLLEDIDRDEIAHDHEPILQIIVNDNEDSNPSNNYRGTTKDSIGVGSKIADVIAVYGEQDAVVADLSPPPPYWRFEWHELGLTCYADYVADTTSGSVHEIHLAKMSTATSSAAPAGRISILYPGR